MVAIICTTIICLTVLLCTFRLIDAFKSHSDITQQGITDEDLANAYKEAERDKTPDFQEVIEFINKNFTGITEDEYE